MASKTMDTEKQNAFPNAIKLRIESLKAFFPAIDFAKVPSVAANAQTLFKEK